MMIQNKYLGGLFVLSLAFVFVGCAAKATDKDAASTKPAAAAQPDSPVPTDENAGTAGLSVSDIPEKFKHDAFEYYGLGATKPVTVELTQPDGTKSTGVQSVKIDKITDTAVVMTITRGGALQGTFGDETIEVREDGIYSLDAGGQKLDKPSLALPKGLTVGKSWSETVNTGTDSLKVTIKSTNKVLKGEKVSVTAGEFETLKLESKGVITSGTTKSDVNAIGWIAKGIGYVKMELNVTTGGKTQKIGYEAISK